MPLAELRRATASGTLMFLPAERVIGGRARYTTAEIAALSGIERGLPASPSRRAMGLPIPDADEAVYTERRPRVGADDRASFARRGSPTTEMLDLLRVLGRGLSQAAETLRALPLRTRARARR